ncbi:MAG: FtsQ-type POTRA domain-containing protein [Syntrophobacteraceae bacterium]|nr:FtsQ-type POTRA domain-containing protein [Syntrophobacteraceae bacterium]
MIKKKRNRYRSDPRATRKAVAAFLKGLARAVLSLAGVLLLSAALVRGYHFVLELPFLKVEEIRITGMHYLERRDILNTLGVAKGSCILDLKTSQLRRRLEDLPWVRDARVEIDFPGSILIHVTERKPMAMVHAADLFLLDEEGKLFARGVLENHPGLLYVTGFSALGLQEGDYLPPEPLNQLKSLLKALDQLQGRVPSQWISECRWRGVEGFTIYTAPNAVPVELGSQEFELRLERLELVLGMLTDRQWLNLVTRIDLNYPDRAYVEGRFPTQKGT